MRPEMILPALLGALVFAALMWWAIGAHSAMWRQVAARYRGASTAPRLAAKIPETIIIAGGGMSYRVYAATAITIHADGLTFRQIAPFGIRCDPLFLPFGDMALKPTSWALWPEPFALRLRDAPGLDIILDRSTVQWIREHVDGPPFGLGV